MEWTAVVPYKVKPAVLESKLKLEKKSITSNQCDITGRIGYYHAHMLLYVSGVSYNVNGNYTQYLAQLCSRLRFKKISTANLLILWRNLPTELRL